MCMLVVVLFLCYFRGHDIWNESFFFFFEYCANISDFIYPTHLYKRVQDEPILNEIFIHRHCKIYVRI